MCKLQNPGALLIRDLSITCRLFGRFLMIAWSPGLFRSHGMTCGPRSLDDKMCAAVAGQ